MTTARRSPPMTARGCAVPATRSRSPRSARSRSCGIHVDVDGAPVDIGRPGAPRRDRPARLRRHAARTRVPGRREPFARCWRTGDLRLAEVYAALPASRRRARRRRAGHRARAAAPAARRRRRGAVRRPRWVARSRRWAGRAASSAAAALHRRGLAGSGGDPPHAWPTRPSRQVTGWRSIRTPGPTWRRRQRSSAWSMTHRSGHGRDLPRRRALHGRWRRSGRGAARASANASRTSTSRTSTRRSWLGCPRGELEGFGDAPPRTRVHRARLRAASTSSAAFASSQRAGTAGWLMVEQDSSWPPPSEAAAIGRRVLAHALA